MTLDIQSGDLTIRTERLSRSLSESRFLNEALGKAAESIRQVPLGNWYQVWVPEIHARDLGMTLFFSRNGLEQVRLKFVPSDLRTSGQWARESEDEIKIFHDVWLTEQIGDTRDFPWGKIASVIDQHGYSAVVWVRYNVSKNSR
jgi:hypothetical protein